MILDTFIYQKVNARDVALITAFTVPRGWMLRNVCINPCIDMGANTSYDYIGCSIKVVYNGTYENNIITGDAEGHILAAPFSIEELDEDIIALAPDNKWDNNEIISICVDNQSSKSAKMIIRIRGTLQKKPIM